MRHRVMLLLLLALSAVPLYMSAQNAAAPFVPDTFDPPLLYTDVKGTYKLKPLGPMYARQDYAAYMGSITHLQRTFSFSTKWPHAGISMAEAVKDVEEEEAGFKARKKFTYAVLNPNESKELGCVYVSPSPKQGYDAQVRLWVIETSAATGFDKRLAQDVRGWLQAKWPFKKVAIIGYEISREEYAKLPDKGK